jgi:hypothetical protein
MEISTGVTSRFYWGEIAMCKDGACDREHPDNEVSLFGAMRTGCHF